MHAHATLGVLISTVGLDPLTAEARLTFDSLQLSAGINFIAAMIGLFGVAEVLAQMHYLHVKAVKQNVSKIVPSWALVKQHLPLSMRSSAIGVGIGALPGAGGDIAALMAYDHARRSTKNPSRPFGRGAYEGVVVNKPRFETPPFRAVGADPGLKVGVSGDRFGRGCKPLPKHV